MVNRLAQESSPYLRQHAHNPVAWLPWGDEAFRLARETDRPVLVSIGYSACHWCHVMERESFDDPTTAAVMNEGFVPGEGGPGGTSRRGFSLHARGAGDDRVRGMAAHDLRDAVRGPVLRRDLLSA